MAGLLAGHGAAIPGWVWRDLVRGAPPAGAAPALRAALGALIAEARDEPGRGR